MERRLQGIENKQIYIIQYKNKTTITKIKKKEERFQDSNPADPVCWDYSLPLRYFLPGTHFIAFNKEHMPNKAGTVSRLRSGTQSICFFSLRGGFVYSLLCCQVSSNTRSKKIYMIKARSLIAWQSSLESRAIRFRQPFYGNYSTLDSHTNTMASKTVTRSIIMT